LVLGQQALGRAGAAGDEDRRALDRLRSAFQTKWVGVCAGASFSYRRMKAASMAKRGKLKLSRSPPKVAARSSGAKASRMSVYFL
jgi:hypothetical protein